MTHMSIRTLIMTSAALLSSAPAFAEASDESKEIIITGIRQAYQGDFGPRETPQSIATINSQAIADSGAVRLAEALDLNASVSRQNNLGGFFDSFAVRGFAGDENFPSNYLVNGFNGGRGFGGPRDTAGLERIEILRGPTAALYGRGEPGGNINLVTKQPIFEKLTGYVAAQYGDFDRYRGEVDANLPIGANIAVRLIGYGEDAGSFRNRPRSDRYGFLPSIAVRLGEETTLRYDLEWTQARAPFDRGTIAPDGRFGLVSRKLFLGEPGDGRHKADVLGHQVQIEHKFSDDWSLLVGGSYRDTSLEGFSSDPELVRGRQKIYVDGRSLSRQRRSRDYDATHLVLRAELDGDFHLAGLRNRVLIGVDYDDFKNDQVFRRFRPPAVSSNPTDRAGYVFDILNPSYGRFPLPTPAPLTDRLDKQRATGFYLQDQITLSETISVRVGGRYDSFRLNALNRLTTLSQERTYNRFSPQIGAVLTASDSVSFYATYGEGFRPNLGADAAGRLFDPEYSISYEAGLKFGVLNNALQGSLAVYTMNKRNVLVSDQVNPGAFITIGKARSRGMEFDLNGRLPGGLEALLSYAYIDAESRSNVLEPNFNLPVRIGDPLINIPRHTFAAQLAKGMDIGTTRLRIGAGVQYVGSRLGETATTFRLPAHTLVRTFANWTLSDRFELYGTVQNLFNTTWYANSFSTLFLQPGTPREATIGLRVKF